jgi:hypothetical protein
MKPITYKHNYNIDVIKIICAINCINGGNMRTNRKILSLAIAVALTSMANAQETL